MNTPRIPHLSIVVAASLLGVACYLGFSLWVVLYSHDVALTGDVVGTWKSFAVAAFSFWLGSSSAGKAHPDTATGKPTDPVHVKEDG